jgi:flagella basal body P-ring formation protein FlgA
MILAAAVAAGCMAVAGERITAADLARAVPAFAALAPETPLGYAPAPGARRLYFAPELARLAARHGIAPGPPAAACFERAVERIDEARVKAALQAALGDQTAQIELVEYSRYPAPSGELEFSRPAAGALLWRGRVRYAGNRSVPVWARARVRARGPRAVALADLRPGRPVAAAEVRIEDGEYCPLGERPADALDRVVGRIPRRAIPKGAPISSSALEAPKAVERGQAVEVEVASGAARLRLPARAESAGDAGQTVVLRNPDNGRRFPARVEGRGKASVDVKGHPQ